VVGQTQAGFVSDGVQLPPTIHTYWPHVADAANT